MYIEDFTFAEEGWKILYRWRGKDEGEEIDIQHEVQCTVSGYLCYSPLLCLCVYVACVCVFWIFVEWCFCRLRIFISICPNLFRFAFQFLVDGRIFGFLLLLCGGIRGDSVW
jgi:hypothetical protein